MKKKLLLMCATVLVLTVSVYAKTSDKDKVVIRLADKSEVGQNTVCVTHGADLTIETNTKVAEYHSTNFYFCTVGEDVKFAKDPEAYLANAATNTNVDHDMDADSQKKKTPETPKKEKKKKDMSM